MSKILVTGGDGQVGMELKELANAYPQFSFYFTDYKDLDITDEEAVAKFFESNAIDFVFNCAAFTAVDKAEEATHTAFQVNTVGAETLAMAAQKHGAGMIHISTDYVYDSGQNHPYVEGDAAHPSGIYAITKYLGDKMVQDILPDAIILRTSWVYSSFGHNFVKTMMRLGQERDSLRIVYDQIGTPTYARDLAQAILEITAQIVDGNKNRTATGGVYHYSNEGVASWFDFAKAIFDLEGISCDLEPILSKEYPTPARRPHFSLMDKTKFKSSFGLKIPYWRDSLIDCLKALNS